MLSGGSELFQPPSQSGPLQPVKWNLALTWTLQWEDSTTGHCWVACRSSTRTRPNPRVADRVLLLCLLHIVLHVNNIFTNVWIRDFLFSLQLKKRDPKSKAPHKLKTRQNKTNKRQKKKTKWNKKSKTTTTTSTPDARKEWDNAYITTYHRHFSDIFLTVYILLNYLSSQKRL